MYRERPECDSAKVWGLNEAWDVAQLRFVRLILEELADWQGPSSVFTGKAWIPQLSLLKVTPPIRSNATCCHTYEGLKAALSDGKAQTKSNEFLGHCLGKKGQGTDDY